MSDSSRPHEPQHAWLPCPSLSPSLLKPMSTKSVMPSNHLILCCPLLLLPSVFPSIRVFPNELAPLTRWPKYWSFRHDYEGKILLLVHRTIPNVLTAVLRWEPFSLHIRLLGRRRVCGCVGDGRNSRTREPPPARTDLGSHSPSAECTGVPVFLGLLKIVTV